jgi:hypothetical protein
VTAARALAAAALALACAGAAEDGGAGWSARELRRLSAEEARQGVAADAAHVYAIDDRRIGKYAKATGLRVAAWSAPEGGAIVHLNGGVVAAGQLVCAHSNYPALPMRSSLEVFDAATLAHVGSRPLPFDDGSATWALPRGDGFRVAFANYAGRGGAPGRGPGASFVARLDAALRPQGRLRFPDAVVRRMGRHASSGASFGPAGLLFATGHDAPELWVLREPPAGDALELVAVVPAPIAGQGVAFDPVEPDVLWTVRRASRELVALRIAAPPPGAGQ